VAQGRFGEDGGGIVDVQCNGHVECPAGEASWNGRVSRSCMVLVLVLVLVLVPWKAVEARGFSQSDARPEAGHQEVNGEAHDLRSGSSGIALAAAPDGRHGASSRGAWLLRLGRGKASVPVPVTVTVPVAVCQRCLCRPRPPLFFIRRL
jgi:hypothetical protein